MNIIMDEAAEVYVKDAKPRRELGTRLFVVFQPPRSHFFRAYSPQGRQHHSYPTGGMI